MKSRFSVAGIAIQRSAPAPKLFIARRNPGGAMGEKWEFPGGKVRFGEAEKEALVREFDEEFSLPVEPLSFIGEAEFTHNETHFTLRAYEITFSMPPDNAGKSLPPCGPAENLRPILRFHSSWRWACMEELEVLDFADSDRLLFPALKKRLAHP